MPKEVQNYSGRINYSTAVKAKAAKDLSFSGEHKKKKTDARYDPRNARAMSLRTRQNRSGTGSGIIDAASWKKMMYRGKRPRTYRPHPAAPGPRVHAGKREKLGTKPNYQHSGHSANITGGTIRTTEGVTSLGRSYKSPFATKMKKAKSRAVGEIISDTIFG